MGHWLDEEIKKLKQNELNLDKDKVKENYNAYSETINSFFEKLIKLYGDLALIMKDDFEFSHRNLDIFEIADYEYVEFSAINMTQKPAFLRRMQFILSDEKGKMKVMLYRGKHDLPKDPWKFHDEQEIHCDIDKFDEEMAYEMIDWLAWKRYSPRSLR